MPLSLCVVDKMTQLILTLHWESFKPSVFIDFSYFQRIKTLVCWDLLLLLAGKAISKVRDKRRHDVKIKIPLSYLWFKAEVSQLCHTGPTQPTSRRGRWCYWVTAMLHEGDEQLWHPRHKAPHLQEQIHHPAFVLDLTDCLFDKSPQKEDSYVPHSGPGMILLLALIHGYHSQLNLTKSRRSAK